MAQQTATPNEQLKRARERHCWSQEHLAELAGTSRVNVSRWEHGYTIPGPHFRQQLCAIFEAIPEALGLLPVTAAPSADWRAPMPVVSSELGAHAALPEHPVPDGVSVPLAPQIPSPPPAALEDEVREDLISHLMLRRLAQRSRPRTATRDDFQTASRDGPP